MDPKQTVPQGGSPGGQEGQNGQPQSSTGVNPVATPIFSSTGASSPTAGKLGSDTLSTGANVSRTIDSLNSKNQSETSQSIFKRKKFDKVVPVSGDLLIDPTLNPERKAEQLEHSKTVKLVGISIAVVAILLLGGIIFALIAGGGKPASVPVATSGPTEKETFSDFLSYFFWGDSSDNRTLEQGWEEYDYSTPAIAADVKFNEPASENKTEYFNHLREKYEKFLGLYTGGMSETFTGYVTQYYYGFALAGNMREEEVFGGYYNNGYEATMNTINSTVVTNSDDVYVVRLTDEKREYLIALLNLINEASKNNCATAEGFNSSCILTNYPSYGTYESAKAQNDYDEKRRVERWQITKNVIAREYGEVFNIPDFSYEDYSEMEAER